MAALRLVNVSFQFRGDRLLLDGVSAQLGHGWCGLVGENGCGKSTLLRLIAGLQTPDSGQVLWSGAPRQIHLCTQELSSPDAVLHDFAMDSGREARIWRDRLHLDTLSLDRWAVLSAGERKRWQVGAALHSQCDVLLLDEPANHLDAESRDLLVQALCSFQGIGILVSHDRQLLDRVCISTWWLKNGNLGCYTMCYTEAARLRDAELLRLKQERECARSKVRGLERRLQQARQDQASAERSRSLKHVKRKDSDSRTLGAKTVRDWAEARLGRQVHVLRDAADRAADEVAFVPDDKLGGPVFLDYQGPRQQVLLRLRSAGLWAGDQLLLTEFAFAWGRNDRIRISGVNGAGKSSLLRALLKHSSLPADRLLVLPQEHSQADVRSMVDEVLSLPPLVRGRVNTLLAALGCSPAVLGQGGVLSPGEARKLHLALGLGSHVWGVVLDEPTNHLDLPSIERLEVALRAFPGAVLLVCHDDVFARCCTNQEFRIENARLNERMRQG